jgi:hypothetical protein
LAFPKGFKLNNLAEEAYAHPWSKSVHEFQNRTAFAISTSLF